MTDWQHRYPDLCDDEFKWYLADSTQQDCRITDIWLDWLTDSGSLTRRLRQLSEDSFSVEVLEEIWIVPTKDQLKTLGLSENQVKRLWSRRVVLKGMNQPWVVAHTLIPDTAFHSPLQRILELRNQPLGELLFTEPGMQRSPIEICRTQTGWGRRSIFTLYNQPLLVAEYLLPALIKQAKEREVK